jgi:hypothetical protein
LLLIATGRRICGLSLEITAIDGTSPLFLPTFCSADDMNFPVFHFFQWGKIKTSGWGRMLAVAWNVLTHILCGNCYMGLWLTHCSGFHLPLPGTQDVH